MTDWEAYIKHSELDRELYERCGEDFRKEMESTFLYQTFVTRLRMKELVKEVLNVLCFWRN